MRRCQKRRIFFIFSIRFDLIFLCGGNRSGKRAVAVYSQSLSFWGFTFSCIFRKSRLAMNLPINSA